MNEEWLKLIVQMKKRYTLLSEIYDLTVQMADALNRDDEVSFSMLLSMRQEPILKMQESDSMLQGLREDVSDEIAKRWKAIENGDDAQTKEEILFKQQISQNGRIIEKIVPLDKRVFAALSNKK